MIDNMHRVYLLSKGTLYIIDFPPSHNKAFEFCVERCERDGLPYMDMVYLKDEDKWYYSGNYADRGTVRDAIGCTPFQYSDKFLKAVSP